MRGRVLRLEVESKILGSRRRLLVYSPAGKADQPLPHILFQDGLAYFGWGKAPQLLDLLVQEGLAQPAHLVFVPPQERTREYAFNPDYLRFLADEVLPLAEQRAPCDGRRTAWGASLGGLLSAQLALARPDLFQGVVAQSGAFLFDPGMDFDRPYDGREAFLQEVRQRGRDLPALRWHLDCGTLEWLLDSNRRLVAALAGLGQDAALHTRSAGHNWVNWRNGLAPGLRRVLG
jgi:enterochelin esterase family protein